MQKLSLKRALQVLFFTALFITFLYLAKPFLVPLTFALIISMLLMPVSEWLQRKGTPGWLAILVSELLFIVVIGAIVYVLVWQISELVKDSGNMEQQTAKKIAEFQQYIRQKLGIPVQQQNQLASGQTGNDSGKYIATAVSGLVAGIGGFMADFILFIVYIFLLLFYRSHLKEFLLRMFFSDNRHHASKVMNDCRRVAQKYVGGLAIMIVCLTVMYSIGFTITGVKNAILFAMLAAVLETIPFIGNITGTLITILMTIAQGGSNMMVLGVFITYVLVQFIQTYFLETLIVGKGVNINPLITIAGIVVGELIWGIPGMVLTIPLLGIAKIIFDNIESLKPVGFLMGKAE